MAEPTTTTAINVEEVRRHLVRVAGIMDATTENDTSPHPCTLDPDYAPRRLVAVITLVILAMLHAQRLLVAVADHRAPRERVAREMLIAGLGGVGLTLFWMDVRRCRLYEGLLKLLVLVGVANVLIPCVWRVPPTPPLPGHDDRDEDEAEQEEDDARSRR